MSAVPCGICHQVFCRCTQEPSFGFGIPVKINPIVPRDEVWMSNGKDLVRLVNLANGEAETARLRRELSRLRSRLRWALSDLHEFAPRAARQIPSRPGRGLYVCERGRAWSGRQR